MPSTMEQWEEEEEGTRFRGKRPHVFGWREPFQNETSKVMMMMERPLEESNVETSSDEPEAWQKANAQFQKLWNHEI